MVRKTIRKCVSVTDIERIKAMIEDLTNSSKHTFTYGDVLRIIVGRFPELKETKIPLECKLGIHCLHNTGTIDDKHGPYKPYGDSNGYKFKRTCCFCGKEKINDRYISE